jgi:NAD(P)H dehydrogenase (quinone)
MIVVTGATGQLGSRIVHHLLERLPAEEVAVSVRDPAEASDVAARGVRVRRGDFADPASLDDAFEGASQVLVVSVDQLGEEAVARSVAAIDAGYRAGAERVLYTSHQGVGRDSRFAAAVDHAAVEAHLAGLGRPYTALRNGYYATTSLRAHVGDAVATGELVAPADGPVAWTAPADLAAGAAAILAGAARFDGPTPPLTGAEAVDLERVAAILSELSGREVRRVVVEDEEYIARLVDGGAPEPMARLFLGSFEASREGAFAATDPALADLIGREPRSIRASLEPIAAAG